jgi:microcystin-dependent protein
MSQPFIGEIRLFAGNFAPSGWSFCNGAVMAISQNETLFNLIGNTYGGDGQNTFALPDLRSRVPVHQGNGFVLTQNGGTETVILGINQVPPHTHPPQASPGGGTSNNPAGKVWANWTGNQYSDQGAGSPMNAGVIGSTGNNQPHDNMLPYLAINFIISLFGVFPSQG